MDNFIDNILSDKVQLTATEKEDVKELADGSILLLLKENANTGEYNMLKNYINKYDGNGYEDIRKLCLKVEGKSRIVQLVDFNYTLQSVEKIKDIMIIRQASMYVYNKKENEFVIINREDLYKTVRISGDVVTYGIN